MKKLLLMAVSLLGMTGCLSEAKSTNTPMPQAAEQKEMTPQPAAPETQNNQEERCEVTFNGQVYKAHIISGAKSGIEGLSIKLTRGDETLEFVGESVTGLERPVTINQLSGPNGEKNVIYSAPSGGTDSNIDAAVLKLNSAKDAIKLDKDVFSALDDASFYEMAPKVKDKKLRDWITNQHMGFHTAIFDSFELDQGDRGPLSGRPPPDSLIRVSQGAF